MTNEQRQELERKIVRHLIRTAKTVGWNVHSVDDGGDERVPVKNETEAMDAIFAVDESRLYLLKNGVRHSVLLVGGNGIDIIADHSYVDGDPDGFEALMDSVSWYVSELEEAQ
jgi:hypothetical protein